MKFATIMQHKIKVLMIAFTAVLLGMLIGYLSTTTSAIPYQGEDTQPVPNPAFNVYTGVPDEGNEADFFKGKVAGSTAPSVDNVVSTCETGKRFQLRVYVHNGASDLENGNGNGPSVAKNTKVRVALPTNDSSEFVPKATISSTNAANVSDTMTITCSDGRVVTLSYVAGTAKQFTVPGGTQSISDSIVTTGAPIGTVTPNGDVWGCWDQRVWVTLIVEVTEVPPVLHAAVCDALLTTMLSRNQIRVDDVEFTTNDAVIENIVISYGDNTSETVSPNAFPLEPHTYGNPGTYTIRAVLNTILDGKAQEITSPDCVTKFTVEPKPNEPMFACDDFDLTFNDRKATVSFVPTAKNGAEFKDANIKYLSDKTEVKSVTIDTVGSDGRVMDMYTFSNSTKLADVDVTVFFTVNRDGEVSVDSVTCEGEKVLGSVTPTPPGPPIPNTGPGETMVGIFAAVAGIGAFAHRKFTLSRR